jgi:gluconate 2-dehydrogenase gamma chain
MDDMEARPHLSRPGLWSRREMLTRGTAVGVVISLPAAGTATLETALAAVSPTASAALTPDQSAVLQAIVARLVPADANGPSGVDAGAAAYIEKSLAGGLKDLAPLYSAGLPAVDAYATSAYGAAFASLPADKQDAVLADMQAGTATGFTPSSKAFFGAIREHTLQGMFCDPAYGGNKNFAGWDLLRYPGVKMPVSARDQKIGVTLKPAHKSTYAGGQFPKAKKEAQA